MAQFNTKAKRSAALGFGLVFLCILPEAHGELSIQDCGQALGSYRYRLSATITGQFDTRAKRGAALGFGLPFTVVLPPAVGDDDLTIQDCAQAMWSYRYRFSQPFSEIEAVNLHSTGRVQNWSLKRGLIVVE